MAEYASSKKLPVEFLHGLQLQDTTHSGRPAILIPYRDEDGQDIAIRYRLSMEGQRFVWRKGARVAPYGLDRLSDARKAGYIILVEGESDAQTLWHHGEPALGLPGASTWKEEWASSLDDIQVIYVFEECDKGGETLINALSKSALAPRIRVIRTAYAKDPSELHVQDSSAFATRWRSLLIGADPLPPLSLEQNKGKDSTKTEILLKLADGVELFHSPDGSPFASVVVNDRRETWPVRSKAFRRWLSGHFYEHNGKAAGGQALQDALDVLEAKAQFDGCCRDVFVRLATYEDSIYLDLANEEREIVEITAHRWKTVCDGPVRFLRPSGLLALPRPMMPGSVELLRPFVNAGSDDDFRILVAFLLAALRPDGPYPVLVLMGEQGSAKSTTARVLRALVDPATPPLRTTPQSERDTMIAAKNTWMLVFDNVSGLSPWLSDTFCRLSTGGGFATRELYTDCDEILFDAKRPIVLNGIGDLVGRQDLTDRCLLVTLPPITDESRRDEAGFWAEFEAVRAGILGGLLNAVSCALANIDSVILPSAPRMIDFARWTTAAEPSFGWAPKSFVAVYSRNRRNAIDVALETDPVATAVRELLEVAESETWNGTMSELLESLENPPGQMRHPRDLPRTAKDLSIRLDRASPTLRAVGVEIRKHRGSGRRSRLVEIRKVASRTDVCDAFDAPA
ncbi:MAG: hypothetical protein HGA39_05915 [Coriobacteriia bacterium]|nr:hypothetical protein [Coriobacteriia bacterium]